MGCRDWRHGFDYAWQTPAPEPDEGPGLTWRQLTPATGQGRGTGSSTGAITAEADGWLAYVRGVMAFYTQSLQPTVSQRSANAQHPPLP
jgi:hypothetical protein